MTEYGQFWPLITLVKAVAYTGGWWIILGAIFKLKKYGELGEGAEHSPYLLLAAMGVGVLLINSDRFMLDWLDTFYGGGNFNTIYEIPIPNALSYPDNEGLGGLREKWAASQTIIFSFLQFWGFFSFVRGLYVFHGMTLGQRNSTFWKGFFHCLGGVIAFHAATFSTIVLDFLTLLNPLSR